MQTTTQQMVDRIPTADDSAGIAEACARLVAAGWAPSSYGQWDALGVFTLWIEHATHGRAAIGVNYDLRKFRDGSQDRYTRTGGATRVARNYRAPVEWVEGGAA